MTYQGGNTTTPMRIAAVVLAAGAGARLGHRPKCLLELAGVPLIRCQLAALTQVGITELVVVLGQHADRIAPVLQDLPVHIVRNPVPNAGQNASLHLGLQALSNHVDAVLVALADQPLINAQDLLDLITAYALRADGIDVVQPQVAGLPGNPVMFSTDVGADILRGETSAGCPAWQAAHPTKVLRWETVNNHYRVDIDCPEDIEALALNTGHRLHWPSDLAHGTSFITLSA
jgi:CTP:molybdopterin cytidylyltransferase MocA